MRKSQGRTSAHKSVEDRRRGASKAPLSKQKAKGGSLLVLSSVGHLLGRGVSALSHLVRNHLAVITVCLGWIGLLVLWSYRIEIVQRFMDRPVAEVKVAGNMKYLDAELIQKKVEPVIGQGFFTLDLFQLKASLESLGWVNKVSIRRVWPNALNYQIEEQVPVAKWGNDALLNPFGEVFVPDSTDSLLRASEGLPHLEGPEGTEKEVLIQYASFSKRLSKEEISIDLLQLNERGEWSIRIEPGMTVRLGREALLDRLDRSLAVYRTLGVDGRQLVAVLDSRYSNGVAVQWQHKEFADALASSK